MGKRDVAPLHTISYKELESGPCGDTCPVQIQHGQRRQGQSAQSWAEIDRKTGGQIGYTDPQGT